MNNKIKQKDKFEKIEILQNIIVIYKNKEKEHFDALYKTNTGVFTGNIKGNNIFVEGGFLPKFNIKYVKYEVKRVVYKKK